MPTANEILAACRAKAAECGGQASAYAAQADSCRRQIADLDEATRQNTIKTAILREASNSVKKMSADLLSELSTRGVQEILGTNMRVQVRTGTRNNVGTMEFELVSTYADGTETVLKPTDEESGGGVMDIVSLSIFLALNLLNGDSNSSIILLDEPTKFVSAGNADKVAAFLSSFAKETGKQLLMVTHAAQTEPYADEVIRVTLSDTGTSSVSIAVA